MKQNPYLISNKKERRYKRSLRKVDFKEWSESHTITYACLV